MAGAVFLFIIVGIITVIVLLKSVLLVGLGGGIGSVFRYLVTDLISRYWPNQFPYGTFLVNITGCLLIGLLIGVMYKTPNANDSMKLLLVTGFCGGYTTFSAFSLENINLIQSGNLSTALLYIGGSLIAGLLAVVLGLYLGKL